VGVTLGDDDDGFLIAERLYELDGAFSSDGQRQDGMGKKDGIPDG
jgi:hypothetical protein